MVSRAAIGRPPPEFAKYIFRGPLIAPRLRAVADEHATLVALAREQYDVAWLCQTHHLMDRRTPVELDRKVLSLGSTRAARAFRDLCRDCRGVFVHRVV